MVHVIIPFEVQSDSVDEATGVISRFIAAIEANEPGTLLYKSYRNANHPASFIHVMAFEDEDAQAFHRNTPHCLEFVEKLYPLCTRLPEPATYTEIR